jgi:hypothetical protein
MSPDNENLYRCLKQIEIAAQGFIFSLPHKGSAAFDALDLDEADAWYLGALIHHAIWLQKKASDAAARVWMQGKE